MLHSVSQCWAFIYFLSSGMEKENDPIGWGRWRVWRRRGHVLCLLFFTWKKRKKYRFLSYTLFDRKLSNRKNSLYLVLKKALNLVLISNGDLQENKELTFVIKDNEGEEFGKLGLHPREVGVSISWSCTKMKSIYML